MDRVVVVGASVAGLRAVETLRVEGFAGEVVLVGAEPHPPYDRPPLSKQVLEGAWEPGRTALRRPDQLDALGLTLRLGTTATALDLAGRSLGLDTGEELAFDGLVLATGASPRRLPGQPDLAGVHVLRTLDDAVRLQAELAAGSPRVVVVGAGFIGAEVASSARHLGLDVTVVEALPVPLERGLGAEMGAALGALHGDHGTRLLTGVGVEALEGTDRVEALRLSDGTRLPADVVVVGIGVVPATGWLEDSGLTLADGVVCDATLAAAPGVYAAGDVCRWPNEAFDGEVARIEHWTNANEQGAAAARNLVAWSRGEPGTAYAPVPFFWSEQYGRRLQFLGRSAGADEVRVVLGSTQERRFLALYRKGDRLWGALGLDVPKPLMGMRKPLLAHTPWPDALSAF